MPLVTGPLHVGQTYVFTPTTYHLAPAPTTPPGADYADYAAPGADHAAPPPAADYAAGPSPR